MRSPLAPPGMAYGAEEDIMDSFHRDTIAQNHRGGGSVSNFLLPCWCVLLERHAMLDSPVSTREGLATPTSLLDAALVMGNRSRVLRSDEKRK